MRATFFSRNVLSERRPSPLAQYFAKLSCAKGTTTQSLSNLFEGCRKICRADQIASPSSVETLSRLSITITIRFAVRPIASAISSTKAPSNSTELGGGFLTLSICLPSGSLEKSNDNKSSEATVDDLSFNSTTTRRGARERIHPRKNSAMKRQWGT